MLAALSPRLDRMAGIAIAILFRSINARMCITNATPRMRIHRFCNSQNGLDCNTVILPEPFYGALKPGVVPKCPGHLLPTCQDLAIASNMIQTHNAVYLKKAGKNCRIALHGEVDDQYAANRSNTHYAY